jgi:hypothetical protein
MGLGMSMQQQYGGSFPRPHAVNSDALVGRYIEPFEPAHESVFRHGVTFSENPCFRKDLHPDIYLVTNFLYLFIS